MRSRATLIPLSLFVCPGGGLILKRVIAVPVAREEMLFAPVVQKTVAMTIACVLCNLPCRMLLQSSIFLASWNFSITRRETLQGLLQKKQSRI
jgi:hypothetical protein